MAPSDVAAAEAAAVNQVRSVPAADLGASRPTGIAFASSGTDLLLAQPGRRHTVFAQADLAAGRRTSVRRLPALPRGATLAFDAANRRLLAVDRRTVVAVRTIRGSRSVRRISLRRLRLKSPTGAAVDARGRTLFILDDGGRAIVRVALRANSVGAPKRISLAGFDRQALRGLAINPADGLFYVLSPVRRQLLAVDGSGALKRTANLRTLLLGSPRAVAFAPSTDATDHPAAHNVFIADRGAGARRGRVVESSIVALAESQRLAATQVAGTLVNRYDTSVYKPAAPDPAGVAYMADMGRLLISDSEVDEMSIYSGVNLYTTTTGNAGTGAGIGTTAAYSKEPTGVGYNPADRTMFISDDDADRVSVVRPGADNVHGTSDDVWTRFSVGALGIRDAEGVEFDTDTGKLWICDGVGTEVYSIQRVGSVWGDADDIVTNFDISQFGARDCEGMGVDVRRDTVLALDPSSKKLYEATREGALVRTIDMSAFPVTNKAYAGVTMAPTSSTTDDPSAMNYWIVDRQVDNGSNPNENDGKLYEVSVTSSDPAPSVAWSEPAEGATVSGSVTLRATASDNVGVKAVQFAVDGTLISTDTTPADGWTATWNTAQTADGSHTLTATAQDTAGQTTTATRTVTVTNSRPDTTAPRAAVTVPAAGATVSGTTSVAVDATDDVGVASVEVRVGATSIGTDVNGADGWSVAWNTATAANGEHAISAVARDVAGNAGTSEPVQVTVANTEVPVVVTTPISLAADDADETAGDGVVRRSNGDIEFGTEQAGLVTIAGMRFAGLNLPPNARVTSAAVQLTADEVGKAATALTIRGHAADNSAPFAGTAFDISGRTRTSAAVSWNPPQWLTVGAAGAGERTPDLSAIVKEIVSRPGWASGSALTLITTGTGRRTAETVEGGFPAVLRVEYTG